MPKAIGGTETRARGLPDGSMPKGGQKVGRKVEEERGEGVEDKLPSVIGQVTPRLAGGKWVGEWRVD